MPFRFFALIVLAFALVSGPGCPPSICDAIAEPAAECNHCCPAGEAPCLDASNAPAPETPEAAPVTAVAGRELPPPERRVIAVLPEAEVVFTRSERYGAERIASPPLLDLMCVRLI